MVITDSHVTANSVIVLQYVGSSDPVPMAIDIRAGRFTAVGTPNRAFRPTAIYFLRMGCYFEDAQRASVAQLKSQQTIVVEGTMRGQTTPGRLMMDHCVLK